MPARFIQHTTGSISPQRTHIDEGRHALIVHRRNARVIEEVRVF